MYTHTLFTVIHCTYYEWCGVQYGCTGLGCTCMDGSIYLSIYSMYLSIYSMYCIFLSSTYYILHTPVLYTVHTPVLYYKRIRTTVRSWYDSTTVRQHRVIRKSIVHLIPGLIVSYKVILYCSQKVRFFLSLSLSLSSV